MNKSDTVAVPRWVLDQLIPSSLGALTIFRQMKANGTAPDYLTDAEIDDLEKAIGVAHDAMESIVINVADYGATGDGSNQTEAIERAVDAARGWVIFYCPNGTRAEGHGGISGFGAEGIKAAVPLYCGLCGAEMVRGAREGA